MDPISALSLACNIIDLVSKAVKGVTTVVEVYKSVDGLSIANETINREADGLKEIIANLQNYQSQPPYITADQKMREISTSLISQCVELQSVLDGCKSSQRWGLFSASNASVKVLRKKGEIEQLQNDIVSSRDELFRWISTSTRTGVNDTLKQLKDISQTNCEIQSTLSIVNALLGVGLGDTDDPTGNSATACLEEIRQVVADRVILQLLDFPGLSTRFEDVVTPEEGTFEWIFTEPEAVLQHEPQLETTFPAWLESGDGIFHICGKPGSGKSTLMKYICRNPNTKRLLAKWSREDKLLIAKFFFWSVWVQEQKSMRGLIRGLLHQILCEVPKLSRVIFPDNTRDKLVGGLQKFSGAGLDSDEIMAAFARLVDVSTSSSPSQDLRGIRICLFIDGLDEFDNIQINQSHRELIGKLCRWSKNSNGHIKICVSSRIQEPFMDMLDRSKRFRLHKLTNRDIDLFIKQKLESHPKFQSNQQKIPKECRDLIHDIKQTADGVFLWVALVLKEMEDGLNDGIPIKRLQKIVSEKPGDLDTLLEQIMNSINKPSLRGVEVLLSAMLRATGTLLSPENRYQLDLQSAYIRNREVNMSALGAFLIMRAADIGISMQEDIKMNEFNFEKDGWFQDGTTDHEVMEMISNIIRTRCKGLIDISESNRQGQVVKFMHRSVPEFLYTYFSRTSASYSDHSSTVVMSWAFLVDVKCDMGSHNSDLLSLSSFLRVRRPDDCYPGKRGASRFFALINVIRQTKLGDEWKDLFQMLVLIEQALDTRTQNFIHAYAHVGLHELIDWRFRKPDMKDIKTRWSEVIYHTFNYGMATMDSALAITETAFNHGADGRITFPPIGPGGKLDGKPSWHYTLLRMLYQIAIYFDERTKRRPNYDIGKTLGAITELWLRHGANPRVRFLLSDDGHEWIGISGAPNNSDYMSTLDATLSCFEVPLSLRETGKGELSLRDIVLYLKPPNESTLLELLKDDIEDNSPGKQVFSKIQPDSSEIKIDDSQDSSAPQAATINIEHPKLGTADKDSCCSVTEPNQRRRGLAMDIPTRQYIRLAFISVLGFIVAYFVQYLI